MAATANLSPINTCTSSELAVLGTHGTPMNWMTSMRKKEKSSIYNNEPKLNSDITEEIEMIRNGDINKDLAKSHNRNNIKPGTSFGTGTIKLLPDFDRKNTGEFALSVSTGEQVE
jgi:hypothetical protein